MSLKQIGARIFAAWVMRGRNKWASRPRETQEKLLKQLLQQARNTAYGQDHNFESIQGYEQFKAAVPVGDYENLRPYVDRVVAGEENVLWPGLPLYFAKTSGTTSGTKYIPITHESMPNHIRAARNAILGYIHETGNTQFVDGKMIFLQGSPILDESKKTKTGRLSGIVAHYVPSYLQKNRLPSWETNCIEDWETKINAIIQETLPQRMTVISGIPSWVQMYFERIVAQTGKAIGEVFPDFSLLIYGGVNFAPYQSRFNQLIGRSVDSIELFPASEGFIAYQDTRDEPGMLLLLDHGIFYEFIPAASFYDEQPPRLMIHQVELDTDYVLILNTNAGLWGYNIGDTVRFTSLSPYRVVVSGRIKHFISASGEHVIGREVEEAMRKAISSHGGVVSEFTVAPQLSPPAGELPYHEWFVSFEELPGDGCAFAKALDMELQSMNSYYKDLIVGKILQPLKINQVPAASFTEYMRSIGKLGGQNKLPRLGNDRKIASFLEDYSTGYLCRE